MTVSVPLVTSTIVISGLTFADGDAMYAACGCGGGVLITDTASVMLNDVVITNSTANLGGGLAVFKANVGLNNNSRISNNYAQPYYLTHAPQTYVTARGGGLYMANANAALNNAMIDGNVADQGGGVFLQNNVLNMFGGSINDNEAYVSGGGA